MAFRKIGSAREEDGNSPFYRDDTGPSKPGQGFVVSDKAFKRAAVISAGTAGVVVILFFVLRLHLQLKVSDADVQALSQITAALSAFMIAVPLFLKDVYRGSNFWKQFFLIAVTFILATVAGVGSFLTVSADVAVKINIWLVGAAVLSIGCNLLATVSIREKTGIGFLLSLLSLGTAAGYVTENKLVNFFVIISFFGFYLMMTLMGSVLIQLFVYDETGLDTTPVDNNQRIKQAIAELADTYKAEALSERQLIYKLQNEKFSAESEIISLTRIRLLVSEMDADTNPANPLVTIYEHDPEKVIPRWKETFQQSVEEKCPRFILLIYYTSNGYWLNDIKKVSTHEAFVNGFYRAMAEKTELSPELLRENVPWQNKYHFVGHEKWDASSYSGGYKYGLLFAGKDFLGVTEGFFPKLYGRPLTDSEHAEIVRLEEVGDLVMVDVK